MARKGGNPDISKHGFTTERPEPLTKQLQIRITETMWQQLQQQDDWREFIRQAIAQNLNP